MKKLSTGDQLLMPSGTSTHVGVLCRNSWLPSYPTTREISDDVSDFLFRQLPFFNFLHYLRLLPFPRQNKIWKTTTLSWELQQNWLCPNLRGIWPSCRTLSRSAAIVIYIVFHWVCYTVQKDTVDPHLSPASQVQQATVLGERKRSTGRKKKHNQ